MRLFLSSWDPQGIPREVRSIVGPNLRCAVVVNACDAYNRSARDDVRDRALRDLGALGFEVHELDLRDHSDDDRGLTKQLATCGMVWVTGGNAFVLRSAIRRSGFEAAIPRLLDTTQLVYGGSSAGSVVAGASLRGVELVDPVADLELIGAGEPIWEGLGLVDFTIAPHYESVGSMREGIDAMVLDLQRRRAPYRALKDGQSLIFDEGRAQLVDRSREAERFAHESAESIDTKHNRN